MIPAYRKQLLALMAKTEPLISEWEAVLADPASDEELLLASKHWREMRKVLADVERKLKL